MSTRNLFDWMKRKKALAVFLAALLPATAALGAFSFVVGLPGFEVVDTATDAAGVTYVLGKDGAGQCLLRKFDSSGAQQLWSGDQAVTRTIAGLTPTALCVAASTHNLYIVGAQKIVRVSADSGTVDAQLAFPATVAARSVCYALGQVYVCGLYTSPSASTIFGKAAYAYGLQSAIAMELTADLSSTAVALTTYGNSNGGNTADSLKVDEAGAVYVSGHLGTGTFDSSAQVNAPGQWRVQVPKAGTLGGGPSTISSLADVNAVASYVTAKNSPVSYYSTINFGSGSQGAFGSDLAFPNGAATEFYTTVSGSIYIPTATNYTFHVNTDDGNWFAIDGVARISTDQLQGATDSSVTVYLAKGMHSINFLQFQHQGGACAELSYTPPGGVRQLLTCTRFTEPQNKAYVFKFNSTLGSLVSSYFSVRDVAGAGGELLELHYAQGWVYAVGFWKGTVNAPGIGLNDSSVESSEDIEVLKLDTDLQLKGRATVKGRADNRGYSVSADDAGNVYLCGSFGTGSVDLVGNGDRDSSDATLDRKFASISASKPSLFVAQLDSNMDYKWVAQPSGTAPDNFSSASKVRWNPVLQRLYWTGYFANGSLTLGQPDTARTLSGGQGFAAVLEPDGKFTEQVYLTVISDYGQSGTQIKPFGGPLVGGNPTTVNRQPVIKGSQVTASVPKIIFRKAAVDVTSDDQADTRIRSTGYSVDNNVATGSAESYTFTITKDTAVTFNWAVDFALNIEADLSATVGTGDPAHGIPGIAGITSLASGNPVPAVQKHWIAKDETVIATIDSETLDLNNPGLPVKYVVTGYEAFGPANTQNSTATNMFLFAGNEVRRQVPQFVMNAPAMIRYHWKLKLGVQVDTTGFSSAGYPLVEVVADPGNRTPPTQSNGVGTGTFWFDEHTSLRIGTLKNVGTRQLKGWLNGDGKVFAIEGSLTNLETLSTTNVGKTVTDLVRPARVMWDYGDRIFEETVYIGNYVTFSTVDDPAVKAALKTTNAPDHVDIIDGPQGSAPSDMGMWDGVGKKYYPLRPGAVLSYWFTRTGTSERVILRLIGKYPASPHYRHIAQTPPVKLDPSTNDLVTFRELKYAEATTGASVDNQGQFTATGPGKTVLLFTETSSSGRGGKIETLRPRVVETKRWNDFLPATQPAIIGRKITSSYDTAGLGTGYLFFKDVRCNAAIYDREKVKGPIIPVNLFPNAGAEQQLVAVWYESRDTILWPWQAVQYEPQWPTPTTGLNRIVIASRFGSESVAQDGTDQVVAPAVTIGTNYYPAELTFNPARFQQVQVYNQPDRSKPGYNPNEEHALMAPSLRFASASPRPMAAYALRDSDLNTTNRDATYTSDPYVLVQFYDQFEREFKMKVFSIVRGATNLNAGSLSYTYDFSVEMVAGEPVVPFYPLPQVIGATPCPGTYGRDGQPAVRRCYWKDHKGTGWAVSGDSYFHVAYFYPMLPDFWWPNSAKQPGDCVAWLPNVAAYADTSFAGVDYTKNDQVPAAQSVKYTTVWPETVPVLKVGETLTFPGGEYRLDHPTTSTVNEAGDLVEESTPGLPGVVGWACGEVIFDSLNPLMDNQLTFTRYTARLFQALEDRTVDLPVSSLPDVLQPANKRTKVQNGKYVFVELPSSLQKRIYYDPIAGKLGLRGFLNDKGIGDSTLTASPPAVYALEPNVLTLVEKAILDGTAAKSPFKDLAGTVFAQKMGELCKLSRNPNGLDQGNNGVDDAYRVGLEQEIKRDTQGNVLTTTTGGIVSVLRDKTKGANAQALGPGLALVANPAFLDPADTNAFSYVTVAENNSDSLGSSPVILHLIKVDKSQRYRGAIKTILSQNVFDENITLRHTGDFGGNADDLVFEWWYRPEDGTTALPPDRQSAPSPWHLFADPSGNLGRGFYQLTLKGDPGAAEALLADSLFYVRYRHKNETVSGVNWEVAQSNGEQRCLLNSCRPGIPYDWAGAGNSSPRDADLDGQPDYLPQLVMGWVKRVLDAVNPYEARIKDFTGDNPATYSSIIRELGGRYEGPVALNPEKNVVENVGLIALYETILKRARDLSIDLSTPISTPAIANALELAATRLADFYLLLGNEAYSDAQNPTIGFGSDSVQYGSLAPSVFSFQNQTSSLLDEELGLLRGLDDYKGPPVYNRFFWNFTKGEGEAAYAMNYNISDANSDGFIDEDDAMVLYPQAHGDAWGHYLTALKMHYDLLRAPYFNWVSRSEFYNLQDIVIPVDYLDERKFARVAAAKAQAGSEIVNLTYRERYVANPQSQWQGYTDTDQNRAWGVEEWARRAGQGAYFDWVTANALLPAVHPNTNYTGIQKVDRTTVQDIAVVEANLMAIQNKMDEADNGANPLGLVNGSLAFDIDPALVSSQWGNSQTLFDQIYSRALGALKNAKTTFDNANEMQNMIRQVANSEEELQNQVFEQDLAYRNQLIEIFGTPYAGTIGSGKAYPAGYQGPDTMLYMYVPVNKVNDDTLPKPTAAYYSNYISEITGDNASFVNGVGAISGVPNSWKERYNLTFYTQGSITNGLNYADFGYAGAAPVDNLPNLNLPVMAVGYTFVAPSDWGQRASPGELQRLITQMIQSQADLATAIYNWDSAQSSFVQSLQLANAKFEYNKRVRDNMKGQIAYDSTMGALTLGFKYTAAINEFAAEALDSGGIIAASGVPVATPTAGLAFSMGDVLAPVRAAIRTTMLAPKTVAVGFKLLFEKLADTSDFTKALGDAIFALENDGEQRDFDFLQTLLALQNSASNEAGARIAVFKQIQVLTELSDQYRAKLAEGQRLIEERTAYNKRVAARTQKNRYQDMAFRVSRNAALEKYRSAFDLAARYTYLAAAAYDYDTNLAWDDAGSPAALMAEIVRQRTIGLAGDDGQPSVGAGGLAEQLAKLKANYDVLKTQLGMNNPQFESATFSLRKECFRLLTDQAWTNTLRSATVYKSDLWQVPEFRRYCRPFSSATNGPQPGLVIRFSTQIRPGKNFFGWALGGGDSSYDPTLYATRIVSAGVWFSQYDTMRLSQTPRVYLVPTGKDIMTIPTDPDLAVRLWDVVDQSVPVPYPSVTASLNDPTWKPLTDSLNGAFGDARRFSSFRAYGVAGSSLAGSDAIGYDQRLIGRSAWNTDWMLIIPGSSLSGDAAQGLDAFIQSVKDIKLVINTYGYSGN